MNRSNIEQILLTYGAKAIWKDTDRLYITAKSKIKFTCSCGTVTEKALRDCGISDKRNGLPYCKQCQAEHKSELISKARTKPEQIIKDPLKERKCSECGYVKPYTKFIHAQSPIEVNRCEECRIKSRMKDDRQRADRKRKDVPENLIETHKKCTGCLLIRELSMFKDDNQNCVVCNASSETCNKKARLMVEEHNAAGGPTIMCSKCLKVKDVSEYTTKTGGGVVCFTCRDKIDEYQDEYKIILY